MVTLIWNIYRNRAIGCWLEDNQIEVIPNVRFGDERTFPIKPPIIVVYGKAPDDVFLKYKEQGIKILQFESEFSLTHKKVVI